LSPSTHVESGEDEEVVVGLMLVDLVVEVVEMVVGA
jgi:hypothetical protein